MLRRGRWGQQVAGAALGRRRAFLTSGRVRGSRADHAALAPPGALTMTDTRFTRFRLSDYLADLVDLAVHCAVRVGYFASDRASRLRERFRRARKANAKPR